MEIQNNESMLDILKSSLLILALAGAVLTGCDPLALPTTPTSSLELPTEIPVELATDTPTDIPTELPTVAPTPTATAPAVIPVITNPGGICVPQGDHGPLPDVDYADYPAAILDYLNQGATPEELAVELIVRGLGPSDQPVRSEDLTGDGYRDVVVSIYNLQIVPQGGLMVYTCVEGQYELSYISLAEAGEQAPKAQLIQDLNNDGLPDLVFTTTSCGAHTCFEDIEILSWIDGAFSDRVEGNTNDLPNPSAQLTDYDQDRIYQLEVVGTAIASVGAGPQRDITKIWQYDPSDGMWKFTSESMAASPFRIHLVNDADDAMRRGEYEIASLLYQQVIEDDDLLDWLKPEEEKLNLSAYATYKRIVAAGFLAQIQQGQELLANMQETYMDYPQTSYVQMAQAFWNAFTSSGSADDGCAAAQQFAVLNQTAVLDPLGSATYGYANRDYGPTDICP